MADGLHRTYRSVALMSLGGVGFVLAAVLAVWVVVDEAGRGHWLVAAAAALWGVLVGLLIIEVFLRPAVSTTAEGVVLVNPFRTAVIPWGAVRGVETELVLQVLTDDRRHTSWAATGRRNTSLRALLGARQAQPAGGWVPGAGRAGAGTPAELLGAGASARGVSAPVECMLFIEAGLSEWRLATARAAATPGHPDAAAGERLRADEPAPQEAVRATGEAPRAPRQVWHLRFLVATAVPAVLLVAVTLAM
jgi:PH (Pleckstrin Homology) domain-containing protein